MRRKNARTNVSPGVKAQFKTITLIAMLNYIFRKPKFPIICDIDGILVAAKSETKFIRELEKLNFDTKKSYPLISISGEGWMFLLEHMAISPLTTKKKWFKKEIIAL